MMQKTIKWLFLFFLVGLPVVTYFFLQGFGENKFDIPIYYEAEGIPDLQQCKPAEYPYLLKVPELIFNTCNSTSPVPLATVFVVAEKSSGNDQVFTNNLKSLVTRVKYYNQYQLVTIVSDTLRNEPMGTLDVKNNCMVYDSTGLVDSFGRCALFLENGQQESEYLLNRDIVLVDRELRIRGYYNALDIIDIDRLVTELRILLNNE